MLRTVIAAAALASSISSAFVVNRSRRDADYCARQASHYSRYCADPSTLDSFDWNTRAKLSKFCPAYEANCGSGGAWGAASGGDASSFVVPPPLPKSTDFKYDLPLGSQGKRRFEDKPLPAQALTPEIVATCTPDCTLPHCTTTCKCANTHPKVHAMCNPPASADIADTCNRWYAKCTMFHPVSYN